MIDETIYGCDYSSTGEISSTGDIGLVDGLSNARQAIHNQLLTRIGTYPSVDNEYGSRVCELWGEDLTKHNLETLEVHIKNALFKQPRVKNIININTFISIDKKIKSSILVELVDGSEETINITLGE